MTYDSYQKVKEKQEPFYALASIIFCYVSIENIRTYLQSFHSILRMEELQLGKYYYY
jgi:hypothetical protein